MHALLFHLPATALTLLLASTVVTYVWSDDPGRRERAKTIIEMLLRTASDRRRRLRRGRRNGDMSSRGRAAGPRRRVGGPSGPSGEGQ